MFTVHKNNDSVAFLLENQNICLNRNFKHENMTFLNNVELLISLDWVGTFDRNLVHI